MHKDTLLDEDMVETHPERVPNSCIDEIASIYRIRKYWMDSSYATNRKRIMLHTMIKM